MKNNISLMRLLVIVLTFGLVLVGCDNGDNNTTYNDFTLKVINNSTNEYIYKVAFETSANATSATTRWEAVVAEKTETSKAIQPNGGNKSFSIPVGENKTTNYLVLYSSDGASSWRICKFKSTASFQGGQTITATYDGTNFNW
jgi:hypothetical protein